MPGQLVGQSVGQILGQFAKPVAPFAGRVRSGAVLAAAFVMLCVGPAAAKGPESVAPLAERLLDAVVNISTSQTMKGPEGVPLPKVPKGAPFDEFFEDFFKRKGGESPSDRKASSLGSGFVIDGKEGLIVTNYHVIEGADEIIANFADGSKLKVERVIGKDPKTDLALLKVTSKKPLPQVPLGSSAKMRVGDWVMAIGNPFGLGGSVTVGIISAKQRDIHSGPYDDYLQTDAAINKGNSGGPLFNMDGEVIGVNTAIISPTGVSIGIAFAVPSDTVQNVVAQLQQYGEVRRGWLGVKVQTVKAEMASIYGVKENTGALVASVTGGSPAAKSGIVDGDVIVKFDGKDITTMRGLPRVVAQTPIGKEVEVELMRKGQKMTLKVTLGRLEEDEDGPKASKAPPKGNKGKRSELNKDGDKDVGRAPSSGMPLIGLGLAPLSDEMRRTHGLKEGTAGVVVTAVDPASPGAEKGVKVGEVIVEVAQEAVKSVDDVSRGVDKVRKAGRKTVLLRIENGKGETRLVAMPVQ